MSDQHSRDDRCFFCASDEELQRGLHGEERRTIHMQTPEEACPYLLAAPTTTREGHR